MIEAIWHGAVIARSDATVVVEGNHYFPREAVEMTLLHRSATTSVCPWKGTAHYYSLDVAGEINSDAAWYYPDPLPAAATLAGRIAFWRGVMVRETSPNR